MLLAAIILSVTLSLDGMADSLPAGTTEWAVPAFSIGSGWAIVAMLVVMLFRGDIGSRREMNARDKQIEFLQDANATASKTINEFTDAIRTSNSLIQSVLDVARERSQG